MSKYSILQDNGSLIIFNTEKACAEYEEAKDWDGRNNISRATGSQWEHEAMYKSSKGRWYIENWSDWQGSLPSARHVSEAEACAWLLKNDHKLPKDLLALQEEVEE